jgi:phospholipid/cholesterol/gamma-HCH transport system substrate-binding protein
MENATPTTPLLSLKKKPILSSENSLTERFMKTRSTDNAKLGFFVLTGLLFLVLTLYMVGKNRNLFGNTFTIKASLSTVNGLMPGNNVRFKGIDVGTVNKIELSGDSSILVVMIIDEKYKTHIKQSSIATIGTDGLMGNRLININAGPGPSTAVQEGSVIRSREPIETDEMLRTLNTTNNTIERVTRNLDEITLKLNSSNSLWNLIADTLIAQDLKDAVKDFRMAGAHAAAVTKDAKDIVNRFGDGEGLAGTLFTDTVLTGRLQNSMTKIQLAAEKTSRIMDGLESVVSDLKAGQGTAGLLLADTVLRQTLMESAMQVGQGTARFNENMEALKSNFLFRRYFRKQERERAREIKDSKKDAATSDTTALSNRK